MTKTKIEWADVGRVARGEVMTNDELSKLYAEKSHECGELRAELEAALERERVLREAVEAYPEWQETDSAYVCLACHAYVPKTWTGNSTNRPPGMVHYSDCLRQRALAQGGEVGV